MARRKRGKYEKPREKRNGTIWGVLICAVLLVGCGIGAWLLWFSGDSVFDQIVSDGYEGTQEQWLASLVGEETEEKTGKSAYQLAYENGYQQPETVWLETLTGNSDAKPGISPYTAARLCGYTGSLAQWLESIAEDPEELGRSNGNGQKTEYELACEYGYTGTFIEWLISVANDRAE